MERLKVNRNAWRYVWPQWLAAIEVLLVAINLGLTQGFISPYMGKLTSPNSPFPVTKEQTTWVVTLPGLSKPIGAIMGTFTTSRLGTKVSMHICGFYYFVGWLFLVCTNKIELSYVCLICNGIAMGSFFTTFPLYIGEISNSKNRGSIVSLILNGSIIGLLLGNIMGAQLEPWMFASVNLAIITIYLVSFSFFPQTPHHLIRCKNLNGAARSIRWYDRGVLVQEEQEILRELSKRQTSLPLFQSFRKLLKSSINLKILFRFGLLCSLVQLSGLVTILDYMEILFTKAHVTILQPSTLVTIVTMASVIPGMWIGMYAIYKFGRIILMVTVCFILTITLYLTGFTYHLLDMGYTDPNIQFMIIISMMIFRMSINVGIVPVISTLMSEIFSPPVKSPCAGICFILSGISTFLPNKYFQYLVDKLSYKYVFYMFGSFILCTGVYAKIFIPETKGKSFEEIKAFVRNRNKSEFVDKVAEAKLI